MDAGLYLRRVTFVVTSGSAVLSHHEITTARSSLSSSTSHLTEFSRLSCLLPLFQLCGYFETKGKSVCTFSSCLNDFPFSTKHQPKSYVAMGGPVGLGLPCFHQLSSYCSALSHSSPFNVPIRVHQDASLPPLPERPVTGNFMASPPFISSHLTQTQCGPGRRPVLLPTQ